MIENELVSAAIRELPDAIRLLWKAGKYFANQHDFLNAMQKYKEAAYVDYSTTQILGMEYPIPLDDIYTEVRLRTKVTSRQLKSIDELEAEMRASLNDRALRKIETNLKARIEKAILEKEIRTKLEVLRSALVTNLQAADDAKKAETDKLAELKLEHDEKGRNFLTHRRQEIAKRHSQTHARLTKSYNSDTRSVRADIELRGLTVAQIAELDARYVATLDEEIERAVQQDIERAIQSELTGKADTSETVSIWDVLEDRDRVVVLGQPGAGKSTLMKHILLNHLTQQVAVPLLPIFVTLREYVDTNCRSLFEFIASKFAEAGFADPGPFLERVLEKRKSCIVLIDGLDEVPRSNQRGVVRDIQGLSKKYRHNIFIVSCRTSSYLGALEGFSEVEIADFGREQIARFAHGWFKDNPKRAVSFLKEIKKSAGLESLTTTPLLLALLCITFKRNQKFPDQRALLYLSCLDALFVDWDSSRQVRREAYVERFDVESKKYLLGKIGCETFCDEQLIFDDGTLVELFDGASEALPIEPNQGRKILDEFVHHHGLLVERAKNIYAFSHLTFHEFFSALHLSKNCDENVLRDLCELNWQDNRWREVTLFLSGLLPTADGLVVALRNFSREKLQAPEYASLRELLIAAPHGLKQFLDARSVPELREGWEAWIRCRIVEYRMRTLGREANTQITDSLPILDNLALLERIYGIAERLRHPLDSDRPTNRFLSGCFLSRRGNFVAAISKEELTLLDPYCRITNLILEIVASRSRMSAQMKRNIVADVFARSDVIWTPPRRPRASLLRS